MNSAMRPRSPRTLGDGSKSMGGLLGCGGRHATSARAPSPEMRRLPETQLLLPVGADARRVPGRIPHHVHRDVRLPERGDPPLHILRDGARDRKSTRLNSSHRPISYAVLCLKTKNRYAVRVTSARQYIPAQYRNYSFI